MRKEGTPTKVKQEDGTEEAEDSESSNEDEDDIAKVRDVLNDWCRKLEEPLRNLQIAEFDIIFDPRSVYGARKGFHRGLMVTFRTPLNKFTKYPLNL